MAGTVLLEDEPLALVRTDGEDVYVERSRFDQPAVIFRISPGAPARPVAQLPLGRPRGVLQAIEGDALLCLEADGTLAAYSQRDGRRHALRRLEPAPAAVAIAPEHVVWCSSDTRTLDGPPRSPQLGEVWRWWRGSERVERLGEHGAFRPDLAAAPALAGQPGPDVFLGAEARLGVIDGGGGLRWLADEPQGVGALCCDGGAAYYATQDRVVRRDRWSGAERVVWRAPIPLALAPWGRALVVGENVTYVQRGQRRPSALVAVDVETGAHAVLARDIGRPAAVAANAHGAFAIEEPWHDEQRRARLSFYPWPTTWQSLEEATETCSS